ncbi:MAG: hypothetical protein KAR19_09470 [Bacteroidales bacterium]|nr:hypothetical protein [Bacteroidales bacterium]
MKLWFQNFASRTTFSWWIIPADGLLILLSVLFTTGHITLKAANRNPVEMLLNLYCPGMYLGITCPSLNSKHC